ncbi:hypothetical protein SFUMM280S_10481 [Streptomyces fumanus]
MTPERPHPAPTATYRLQLQPEFPFAAAAAAVPYLASLGVSHLHLSPVLEAVPGSTHGYDVVDGTGASTGRWSTPTTAARPLPARRHRREGRGDPGGAGAAGAAAGAVRRLGDVRAAGRRGPGGRALRGVRPLRRGRHRGDPAVARSLRRRAAGGTPRCRSRRAAGPTCSPRAASTPATRAWRTCSNGSRWRCWSGSKPRRPARARAPGRGRPGGPRPGRRPRRCGPPSRRCWGRSGCTPPAVPATARARGR